MSGASDGNHGTNVDGIQIRQVAHLWSTVPPIILMITLYRLGYWASDPKGADDLFEV